MGQETCYTPSFLLPSHYLFPSTVITRDSIYVMQPPQAGTRYVCTHVRPLSHFLLLITRMNNVCYLMPVGQEANTHPTFLPPSTAHKPETATDLITFTILPSHDHTVVPYIHTILHLSSRPASQPLHAHDLLNGKNMITSGFKYRQPRGQTSQRKRSRGSCRYRHQPSSIHPSPFIRADPCASNLVVRGFSISQHLSNSGTKEDCRHHLKRYTFQN